MRVKAKYATLIALVILTATPRAFDQLADLTSSAQERFRTELLNIFWNLTTPESRRGHAQRNAELLARMQEGAARTNDSETVKLVRVGKRFAESSLSASTTFALRHRQLAGADPLPSEGVVAHAAGVKEQSAQFIELGEEAQTEQQEAIAFVARNFTDYPIYDETAAPVSFDDTIAQLRLNQVKETAATPKVQPVPNVRRLARKFTQTNFQFRLPENLKEELKEINVNTELLIKTGATSQPDKPNCRVRIIRSAPDAPRAPKPVIIS